MSRNSKRRRAVKKQELNNQTSIKNEITRDKTPVIEKDNNGNVTHKIIYTGESKQEYWIEYDSNLPIHMYSISGYECWWKYNNVGNISDFWDNTGYQEKYKYYKNDIVICTNNYNENTKKVINRNKYKYITRELFMAII